MKLLKKIACFMCAAALAVVPAVAWAATSASVDRITDTSAEVYAIDVNGQHSVHVNLKIQDENGDNVPSATFTFSAQALGNKVANSHYIDGVMSIIVSNAQNVLAGENLNRYDLGTLQVSSQTPVTVEVTDVSSADISAVANKIDNSNGSISQVVLGGNAGTNPDDPNDPGYVVDPNDPDNPNNPGNTGDWNQGDVNGVGNDGNGTGNGSGNGINGGTGGSNSQTSGTTPSGSSVGNDPTLSRTGDNMGIIIGACLLAAAVAAAAIGILMFRRSKGRNNQK